MISGALGNLIDRIRYGYVIDFIHVHIRDVFSWPVFNVADILIVAGIGLLLLQLLLSGRPGEAPGRAGAAP